MHVTLKQRGVTCRQKDCLDCVQGEGGKNAFLLLGRQRLLVTRCTRKEKK